MQASAPGGREAAVFVVQYEGLVALGNLRPFALRAHLERLWPAAGMPRPVTLKEEHLYCCLLCEACGQVAGWRRDGVPFDRVVVPVPRPLWPGDALLRCVRRVLCALNVSGRYLQLEVPEDVLLQAPIAQSARTIAALEALNVRVAVSGMGLGFGSLHALRSFRFRTMALAAQVSRRVLDDPLLQTTTGIVVAFAVQTGREVLATGLDRSDQCAMLARLGCHGGSGSLFGGVVAERPLRHPARAEGA